MQSRTATHTILVVEHDCVRRGQVDVEPACAIAPEEQARCIWRVAALLEAVYLCAAIQKACGAVDAAQRPALALVCTVLPWNRARRVNLLLAKNGIRLPR